jgi:pimeloyl-ACP methyl ester carboxylesterase
LIAAREQTLHLPGSSLALLRLGDPAGAKLLCLHGWLDNAASFEPLAAELPGYELLALDLAGHGRSPHRAPDTAYHQLDWVRDVFAAADALGLERFALVGHSMGAGIAALAAGTLPERVSQLVMLEGLGPRAVEPGGVPAALAAHLAAEQAQRALGSRHRPARFEIAVRARLVASPLTQDSAERLARRGTAQRDGGYVWTNDRRLHHVQPFTLEEPQIRSFFERVQCPTLLVWASDGLHRERSRLAPRTAYFRDLRAVEVPGRHHVHMDDAACVARQMLPFLAATRG